MLSQVTIGIKTFLRDQKLFNTIDAIRRTLPECKMIIADDGWMSTTKLELYAKLEKEGHTVIIEDFDVGFGTKSNDIAASLKTNYLLIGSDDFDFNPPEVRKGIEKLHDVLYSNLRLDIASGRVKNRPYEFFLTCYNGEVVEEPVIVYEHAPTDVDLTVNYSLIRKNVFTKVRWDDDVKIGGGEHGAFFYDCARAGVKTVFVPGVNINEQEGRDSDAYRLYRNRALSKERPCFVRRGITKYVLGTGEVDYQV
jgi:hypothetical protein